jgi:hypothetical protein
MKKIIIVCGAPLLVLLPFLAFGQGLFATVTGSVSDVSGALIPDVSMKATAVDTGVVSTTVTNESGAYNFSNLLPGKYTISASLPGWTVKRPPSSLNRRAYA